MSENDVGDYVDRILYDLIFYVQGTPTKTEWFLTQKHNADLCPLAQSQADMIISLFERYRKVVHDTQGLRDRGIDVMVRYQEEGAGEPNFIGIQIKSHDDLKEEMWLTKLKAQCFEAIARPQLKRLYVILATSIRAKGEREKIRAVAGELGEHPNITIVEPEYAFGFLHLSSQAAGAFVKRFFSKEDIVFRTAVESLDGLTRAQCALVVEAIRLDAIASSRGLGLSRADLVESSIVRELYSKYRRVGERGSVQERVAQDIDALDGDPFQTDAYSDRITVRSDGYNAVKAIMLDGEVRYGYKDQELVEYLVEIAAS
jgi:hypothetical protein